MVIEAATNPSFEMTGGGKLIVKKAMARVLCEALIIT